MHKKSFSTKKIFLLVVLLAVPGLLYYLLQEKGKNRYKPLPFYGSKQVASTFHMRRGKKIADTIYHTIEPFALRNQNDQVISFPADSHRITVVNFFFTRCSTFCKPMTAEVSGVANIFRKNKLLQFYSITVDPENDTPGVLKKYQSALNLKPDNWDFLTGSSEKIMKLAQSDFLVDALEDTTTNPSFIHTPMLILVDPQRRIRGYYNSANKEEVDKLTDEIKVLITEELRGITNR